MTNSPRVRASTISAFLLAALGVAAYAGCEADTTSNTPAKDSGVGSDTGTPVDTGTNPDTPPSDTPTPASEELIDDMEGGTGSIASTKGRVGAWYVYNDGTAGATQTPGTPFVPEKLATPRGASKYAAHSTGKGFITWGAGFGFNLNDKGDGDGGSAKTTYDASAYTGITFYAKVNGTSATKIRVNVSTIDTDPAGAKCGAVDKCSDHYGADVTLTGDWAKYTVNFADLSQQGWGTAAAKFDATKVYAMQFQFGKGQDFDASIDDISFLKK